MKYLVSILILISTIVLADSAPMIPVQGSSVKPINNNDIMMESEVVNVYMYRKYYEVVVKYNFINTGKAQKVIMGFPNIDDWIHGVGIKNYTVLDNNKKIKTIRKETLSTKEIEKIKSQGYGELKYFETSEHFFKKGEKRLIVNKYKQDYMYDYNNTYRKAIYILKTGSFWKGKIKNIKVNIHFMDLSLSELYNRSSYFYENKKFVEKLDYKFDISPKNYTEKNNVLSYEFKNLEPDFNIEISIPPLMFENIEADSTLKSKKINKYSAKNLIDNNPKTAWVEGSHDFGKDVKLYLTLSPTTHGGKLEGDYLIDKVAIINGYAKSKKIFKANNRVKKIKFQYWSMKEDKEFDLFFTLKDTSKMQYIKFKKPIYASNFRISILSVYKGEKYNDTCISEIKVFPVKD